jgi:hypothetical protein
MTKSATEAIEAAWPREQKRGDRALSKAKKEPKQ